MAARIHHVVGVLALSLAGAAFAQTPELILQRALDAGSARLEGVRTVAVRKSILGITHVENLVRHDAPLAAGGSRRVLRHQGPGAGTGGPLDAVSPNQVRDAAAVIRSQAPAVDAEIDRQMQQAGVPAPLQQLFNSAPAD